MNRPRSGHNEMQVRNFGSLGRWVLALTIVESALVLGTVRTSGLLVLIVCAGVAAALLHRNHALRTPARVLLWAAVGLVAFTALQALPLPATWVAAIAPHNADVWARALRPLGERGPRFVTLSVDPVATRAQAARGLAYVLTFLAALALARTRGGARFLMWSVLVSGTLVTIAALVHPAFDQTKVFGLYAPHSEIAPRHIAPLLNANHLAAYLNITLCCALALSLNADLGRARVIPGAVAVLVVAAQFWVASRGGVVAMFIAIAAVAVLRLLRSRSSVIGPAVFGLVIVGGVAMAVFGRWESAWSELADTDVSKVQLFAQDLPMLHAYAGFGAGRGAFETAFPEFRTSLGYDMMTNPENILLQWGIEWGIPVALAGLIAVVFALRPSVALARGRWTAGAWAALAAVGLHNLVDFSSETPGVVVALCVCAAIVVGGTRVSREERAPNRVGELVPVLGAAGVAFLYATSALGRDVETDRTAMLAARTDPDPLFADEVRGAMLRHPAEPYLPYAGGLHARSLGGSVVPWVERTLERARIYGPAHLLLARELARRSPAQSRLEDRIGIEQVQASGTTDGVLREAIALGLVRSYEDATELVPAGAQRAAALEILSAHLTTRFPATSARLDSWRLALTPTSTYVLRRRSLGALADLRAGAEAPWCEADRSACLNDALAAAQRFEAADPQACEAHATESEVRLQGGDAQSAYISMRNFTQSVGQKGPCLSELAGIAIEARLPTEASAAIDELAKATCTATPECVSNLVSAGSIERSRNNPRRALAFFQQAADLAPDRDDINGVIADLSLSLGLFSEASTAYQRLLQRHPDDAAYKQGLQRANDGLLRYRVGPDDLNSAPP